MRKFSLLLICFLLAGCATARSIKREFLKVNYSDGINREEALVIAENTVINDGKMKEYQYSDPKIYDDDDSWEYSDYWLVHFEPGVYEYEIETSLYLVVIEKENGNIKFSGVRRTLNENSIEWIFK